MKPQSYLNRYIKWREGCTWERRLWSFIFLCLDFPTSKWLFFKGFMYLLNILLATRIDIQKQRTHQTKRKSINSTFITDNSIQHFNFFATYWSAFFYVVFLPHNKIWSRQRADVYTFLPYSTCPQGTPTWPSHRNQSPVRPRSRELGRKVLGFLKFFDKK